MSFPRVQLGWSCLRRLASWIFWLSLLGLLGSLGLAGWAYILKQQLGDHLAIALPAQGYLLPGTLSLAVFFVAPCHLLGVTLWPSIVKDFARRRNFAHIAGKKVNRLLLLHALLSCLSGWLAVGTCAGGAYYWDQTRRRLGQGLRRAMRRYHDDETVKTQLDRMQVELGCCGSDSFVDWFFVPWVRTDGEKKTAEKDGNEEHLKSVEPKLAQRREEEFPMSRDFVYLSSLGVPYSCCLAEVLQSCEHRNLFALESYAQLSIATEGCCDKLLDQANEAELEVFACLVLIAGYQLLLSVLSRLLQTGRLSALLSPDAKGKRFASWIFGTEPRTYQLIPETHQLKNEEEQERLVPDNNSQPLTSSKHRQHRKSKNNNVDDDNDERVDEEEGGDDEDSDAFCLRYRDGGGGAAAAASASVKVEHKTEKTTWKNKKTTPGRICKVILVNNRQTTNCAASTSSTSSLTSLPPTLPRRASRKVTTQSATFTLPCPLHNRCPAQPPRAKRLNCPVHGDFNVGR